MVCQTRLTLVDRYNDARNNHAALVRRLSDMARNVSSSSFESALNECKIAKQLVGDVYDELFRRTRQHGCGIVTKESNVTKTT